MEPQNQTKPATILNNTETTLTFQVDHVTPETKHPTLKTAEETLRKTLKIEEKF
jgi:hypothetical protein